MKKVILILFFLSSCAYGNCAKDVPGANVSKASEKFSVPKDILCAIMKVESGFNPWAIHLDGKSHFFTSKEKAVDFALESKKKGNHSLNLGLMQIYWPVHKHSFNSIEDGLDPKNNLFFAAQFLQTLKKELGSWTKAVKAYHSRVEQYGNRYAGLISKALGYPLESILN